MNNRFLSELNIEALIKIKENSFNGHGYLNIENFVTTDIDVINYRLDALGDLLENRTFFLRDAGDNSADCGIAGAAAVQLDVKGRY